MAEDDGTKGILTARDVMARSRRTLELPSGGRVIVGRIDAHDILAVLEMMPPMSETRAAALASASSGGESALLAAMTSPDFKPFVDCKNLIVRMGMIEPKLFEDRAQGPTAEDFGIGDRMAIYRAILELSDFELGEKGQESTGRPLRELLN
jgi:hypothetical protein